jgi:murein L,D-transpeptidase YcbB/YkuD
MGSARKLAVLGAGLLGAGLLTVVPAGAANAISYCNIDMVWQNAFVPGRDSNPFTPNCQLSRGSTNNAVASLQDALKTCHHKNISVDGDFGPATQTALRQVQSSLHIGVDGIYGPQTARAMSHPIVGGGGACKRITF